MAKKKKQSAPKSLAKTKATKKPAPKKAAKASAPKPMAKSPAKAKKPAAKPSAKAVATKKAGPPKPAAKKAAPAKPAKKNSAWAKVVDAYLDGFGDIKKFDLATRFDYVRLNPTSGFFARESEAPPVALGQSRIGGPIVDLPPGVDYPAGMNFVAQIDLSQIAKHDPQRRLPKTGHLYFFYGFNPRAGDTTPRSLVFYSDAPTSQLRRTVREHQESFWRGKTVGNFAAEQESLADRVDAEGQYDYFAGMDKTKLFGVHANCQRDGSEVGSMLASGAVLLFQSGEDTSGYGSLAYFIGPDELASRDFSQCRVGYVCS